MNKNSSLIIAGGIGIVIITIIIFYINQESEVSEINGPTEIKLDENVDPQFNEKLNEIEKNADENYFEPAPRDWQTSGPFQIDRTKYLIGEKIFVIIGGLSPDEKGQISFLRPGNETHYVVHQTIPFDGMKKNAFNYYTDVRLSEKLGICSINDIIGEWTVVFRGTDYPNLKFEIINEILPGEEDSFEPVC